MEKEQIKRAFGNCVYNTTLLGIGPEGSIEEPFDVLVEIVVKGSASEISWQDVYRRIIRDLERSIPALEAAGLK